MLKFAPIVLVVLSVQGFLLAVEVDTMAVEVEDTMAVEVEDTMAVEVEATMAV